MIYSFSFYIFILDDLSLFRNIIIITRIRSFFIFSFLKILDNFLQFCFVQYLLCFVCILILKLFHDYLPLHWMKIFVLVSYFSRINNMRVCVCVSVSLCNKRSWPHLSPSVFRLLRSHKCRCSSFLLSTLQTRNYHEYIEQSWSSPFAMSVVVCMYEVFPSVHYFLSP